MTLIILGVIFIVSGAGLIIHGIDLNNNIAAQLSNLFRTGYTNPGNNYIIFGIVVIIIGLVVVIVGYGKNEELTIFNNNIRKCPFCANEINFEAIICQYCGKDLPDNNTRILLTEFIPTHHVKLPDGTEVLGLRNGPDVKIKSFIKIPNGTEVQYIDTGNDVIYKETKAPWFFVRTKDGIRGWCFSGILEKI
jgi:hypothetical protein